MTTLKGAVVELSGGNIRNSHFYLRDMPWIPREVIGGSNEASCASKRLEVHFGNGTVIETDIAGDKMILRNREAVRRFFLDIGATEGTRLVIEQTGPFAIAVTTR